MNENLIAIAKDNMIRISPSKLSILVNSIVNMKVSSAINQLNRNFVIQPKGYASKTLCLLWFSIAQIFFHPVGRGFHIVFSLGNPNA